ncbi:deoxycytidyl transferase [Balamuthia mandrillaris]
MQQPWASPEYANACTLVPAAAVTEEEARSAKASSSGGGVAPPPPPEPRSRAWRSYMEAKKEKLTEQFRNVSYYEETETAVHSSIFKNVVIWVNGYTTPSLHDLRRMVVANGGSFVQYFNGTVTHIVACNLTNAKHDQYSNRKAKVVRPEWLVDSVREGKQLPSTNYLLEKPTSSSSKTTEMTRGHSSHQGRTATDPNFLESYFKSSRLHHLSTWRSQFEEELKQYLQSLEPEEKEKERRDEATKRTHLIAFEKKEDIKKLIKNRSPGEEEEEEEEEDYVDMEESEEFESTMPVQRRKESPPSRVIMHVDMDCFFASVALLDRPELKGKPIVVCHSDSPKGTSDIACASYEARKYGVKNGMLVGMAKELCPQLVAVPYDFDKYEKISKQMYKIFARYTRRIQVVSCDEALLDLSDHPVDPCDVAHKLRSDIFAETGCTASAGIGHNILLAKLATRKAKPNGQYLLSAAEAPLVLATLPVASLPGIGWKLRKRLKNLKSNVENCSDILRVDKEELHQQFGQKLGEKIWNYARGIDERPLQLNKVRKSMGVDVNWGIRFTQMEEMRNFMLALSQELSNRLQKASLKGHSLVLKLKKRKEDAPEAYKYLGHGIVDSLSRSTSLSSFTDSQAIIFEESWRLWTQLKVAVEDVRGVGIHMQRLNNNSNNRNEANQERKKTSNVTLFTAFERQRNKQLNAESEKQHQQPNRTGERNEQKAAKEVASVVVAANKKKATTPTKPTSTKRGRRKRDNEDTITLTQRYRINTNKKKEKQPLLVPPLVAENENEKEIEETKRRKTTTTNAVVPLHLEPVEKMLSLLNVGEEKGIGERLSFGQYAQTFRHWIGEKAPMLEQESEELTEILVGYIHRCLEDKLLEDAHAVLLTLCLEAKRTTSIQPLFDAVLREATSLLRQHYRRPGLRFPFSPFFSTNQGTSHPT